MTFDSGFAQGRGMVQQSLDNIQRDREFALRQAAADREAQDFDMRKKDTLHRQAADARQDTIFGNGQDNTGPYEDSAPGGITRPVAPQPLTGSTGVDATGQPTPPAAGGMAMPAPSAPGSMLDAWGLAEKSAMARNDAAGVIAARIGQRQAAVQSIQDMVGKMTPEQRAAEFNRLNLDSANHINLYSLGPQTDAKGKSTGYTTLGTRNPDGSMSQIKLNPAEEMQFLTGAKLMEAGHAAEGSQMMLGINDRIDKIVTEMNASTLGMVNANNTARHNQVTGAAMTTTANAAAQNASTEAKYKGLQGQMLQGDLDAYNSAKGLVAQYQALSPSDQMGEKGRGLEEQYRLLQNGPGKPFQQLRQPAGSSAALKYQTDNLWADIEKKLGGENTPPKDIETQRQAFYARRGFAPQKDLDAIMSGRDPTNGKQWTAADVDKFNSLYPNSPVNKADIPGLQAKPGGLTPPTAVTPAPASSAKTTVQFTVDPAMEEKATQQSANLGPRGGYTPDVLAYLRAKSDAEDAVGAARRTQLRIR